MPPAAPTRRRRSGLRLEHKVALLTALPILVLGAALGNRMGSMFQERLLVASRQVVAPATAAVTDFLTTPDDYANGLPADKAALLTQVMAHYTDSGLIQAMRMYRPDGLVVWSTVPGEAGRTHPLSRQTRSVGVGEVKAEVESAGDLAVPITGLHGKVIAISVPVTFNGPEVVGLTELYLPYAGYQAAVDHDTREIYVILGIGLLVLWVLLTRIVTTASRTLRRQADENEHLALHDTLTGLPNRTYFQTDLEQAIARARRADGRMVGVLLLDLDRFKEVNDSLGHHEGDHLLVEIAHRLQRAVRGGDTVARLGGDEFAVVLHELTSVEDAIASAERIHRVLDVPVDLGDLRVQVDASIGIALFPDHGDDADGLLQRADVAMYTAKASAADWSVYDAAVDPNSPHRLALVAQLRGAIDTDELVVHYQPVAHLRTGDTISMEALVRWQHPVRGLIPPIDFIPAAEGSGLIRPLTLRVLREAMTACVGWLADGTDVSVAVNLSARNVQDPRCPEDVLELLEATGLPPGNLVIEITESAVLGDPHTALSVLTQLRAHGIRVALDDFGTGYSSLTQLKDLPVDEIKIDRSFVTRVGDDSTTTAIVKSIVELGGRLDMHVVAEGVEDADIIERLTDLGCELAQGYFFSRPLPPEQAGQWLQDHAVRNAFNN